MNEVSLKILNIGSITYKRQKNILYTVGIILITAGANTLSGNLIITTLKIVNEYFSKKPVADYDIIIGLLLLLIGFYCIYLGFYNSKILNHDKHKYNDFLAKMDVHHIKTILFQIKSDFYYKSDQDSDLYFFQDFLSQTENSFLDRNLNTKIVELYSKLKDFTIFRHINFEIYPKNQTHPNPTYWLKPELDKNKKLYLNDPQKSNLFEEIKSDIIDKSNSIETTITEIIITAKKLGL